MWNRCVDSEIEIKLLMLEDSSDLFRLTEENRDRLKQWLPWIDQIKAVSDSERFIRQSMKQWIDQNGFQAGIWFKNTLAGVIGYHRFDWSNRSTSIGYWLGQKYAGKGVMTRSCRTMTAYALNELLFHRVEIRCATENTRSRAIPMKLGFHEEGVLRHAEWLYDHYVDHVVYSLLSTD